MSKKRLVIKDKKLRDKIYNFKRDDARKDFFELLKRASKTTDFH